MNLRWNTSDYGGVKDLRIPPHRLWKPDVLMYNRYVFDFKEQSKSNKTKNLYYFLNTTDKSIEIYFPKRHFILSYYKNLKTTPPVRSNLKKKTKNTREF